MVYPKVKIIRSSLIAFDAHMDGVTQRSMSEPAPQMSAALSATWWFIENVASDDPDRDQIYFKVRSFVRNVP